MLTKQGALTIQRNFRKFPWANGLTVNDTEQRVVIDGVNSSSCSIPPGVPQGSLLGPLFFVIFINDLPEVVAPENTVSLYADDCKTSRVINFPADHSLFQSDIDNIYRWSLQNRMEFNVKKCKLMQICKEGSPLLSDLHLNIIALWSQHLISVILDWLQTAISLGAITLIRYQARPIGS